jgi:hypothetical protein
MGLKIKFYSPVVLWPHAVHGLLLHMVSRSHTTNTPQSVELLWTSDQLVAQTSTCQHTNIHIPGGIRADTLSRPATADLHLRPRGQWDRLLWNRSIDFIIFPTFLVTSLYQ